MFQVSFTSSTSFITFTILVEKKKTLPCPTHSWVIRKQHALIKLLFFSEFNTLRNIYYWKKVLLILFKNIKIWYSSYSSSGITKVWSQIWFLGFRYFYEGLRQKLPHHKDNSYFRYDRACAQRKVFFFMAVVILWLI